MYYFHQVQALFLPTKKVQLFVNQPMSNLTKVEWVDEHIQDGRLLAQNEMFPLQLSAVKYTVSYIPHN